MQRKWPRGHAFPLKYAKPQFTIIAILIATKRIDLMNVYGMADSTVAYWPKCINQMERTTNMIREKNDRNTHAIAPWSSRATKRL